ncbi:MerR family transcriptional regulator [Halopseudomonas sp.]|uniref:MerR family transcriptional regulator n=1 Tax=Halopseudomonas sp. TaxID=2901191 RepID=UPI0035649247
MTDTTDPIYAALDPELEGEDLYPIREVSRLTGVNPVTLRAWERRYGLLVPHRTESGHRLYSMADIERVRKVTAWIDRGVAVSKVASIIDREVATSPAPVAGHDNQVSQAPVDFRDWQARLVEAVNSSDLARLDRTYGQIHSTFPVATVLRDIAMPVWKLFRDKAGPESLSGEWSFLDAFLRGRLFQRIGYLRPGLPTVLLAAMPGSGSEFEILSAAALVAEAEANITYVPTVSSYAELTAMAERSSCDVLMLYGDHALEAQGFSRALPRLEQSLICPVVAVGPVCEVQPAELKRAGITVLGLPGPDLVTKVRNLLIGRLDTR